MQTYRISIWTSVDVEAGNKEIAEIIAKDMMANAEIKNRDFTYEAEEIE